MRGAHDTGREYHANHIRTGFGRIAGDHSKAHALAGILPLNLLRLDHGERFVKALRTSRAAQTT